MEAGQQLLLNYSEQNDKIQTRYIKAPGGSEIFP
jgi:hypothetical protein